MSEPRFGDAVPPDSSRWVESNGARLRVHCWGDPQAPAIVLCHGMFDHARGFDLLAPLLAERFYVQAIDARGHGDSSWVDTYLWQTDVMDIVNVLRALGRPADLVGHSKGGGQATDAAILAPEWAKRLVNIDGFGPPDGSGFGPLDGPDLSALGMVERCAMFLDRRRGANERTAWRAYDSLDELVSRRASQNPRLDPDWLRYFVFHAASESSEGWRWKSDPQMVAGGFGPFKPEWIAPNWVRLKLPMLAMIGSVPDTWGPLPEEMLASRLDFVPMLERATIEGAGHFLHMERPAETAAVILDFLESA